MKSRTHRFSLPTLAVAVFSATLPLTGSSEETLRSTSRLVQVNVLVHDSKGAPVRDLAKEDFTVLDNGTPRRLAVFRLLEKPSEAAPTSAAHPLLLSNRSSGQAEGPIAATIILFDAVNLRSTEDALYIKRELPRFLKNLRPGDPVAIYSLAGPKVTVIHDFSDDTESLIRSAERNSGVLSQWLRSSSDHSEGLSGEKRIRAEWTLAALDAIAQHVASIPGRKTLVWLSSAFPITAGFTSIEDVADGAADPTKGDIESYRERLQRLARTYNSVDIAVYPVDPRGLVTEDRYQSTTLGDSAIEYRRHPRLRTVGELTAGDIATMNLLATETGGRAFYNANALGDSIQRAVDDARVTYLLGFYPEAESWDGKRHKLEVRVNRPGVDVRARKSYFAGDPPAESEPVREAALETAASTALSAAAVGLTAQLASNPLEWGLQQVEVSVDPRDLHFENVAGKWHADFDLILIQKAPDGRRLAGERSRCILDRETYQETQTKELSFQREVEVQRGAAKLLIMVRDSVTGEMGSLEAPIKQEGKPAKR